MINSVVVNNSTSELNAVGAYSAILQETNAKVWVAYIEQTSQLSGHMTSLIQLRNLLNEAIQPGELDLDSWTKEGGLDKSQVAGKGLQLFNNQQIIEKGLPKQSPSSRNLQLIAKEASVENVKIIEQESIYQEKRNTGSRDEYIDTSCLSLVLDEQSTDNLKIEPPVIPSRKLHLKVCGNLQEKYETLGQQNEDKRRGEPRYNESYAELATDGDIEIAEPKRHESYVNFPNVSNIANKLRVDDPVDEELVLRAISLDPNGLNISETPPTSPVVHPSSVSATLQVVDVETPATSPVVHRSSVSATLQVEAEVHKYVARHRASDLKQLSDDYSCQSLFIVDNQSLAIRAESRELLDGAVQEYMRIRSQIFVSTCDIPATVDIDRLEEIVVVERNEGEVRDVDVVFDRCLHQCRVIGDMVDTERVRRWIEVHVVGELLRRQQLNEHVRQRTSLVGPATINGGTLASNIQEPLFAPRPHNIPEPLFAPRPDNKPEPLFAPRPDNAAFKSEQIKVYDGVHRYILKYLSSDLKQIIRRHSCRGMKMIDRGCICVEAETKRELKVCVDEYKKLIKLINVAVYLIPVSVDMNALVSMLDSANDICKTEVLIHLEKSTAECKIIGNKGNTEKVKRWIEQSVTSGLYRLHPRVDHARLDVGAGTEPIAMSGSAYNEHTGAQGGRCPAIRGQCSLEAGVGLDKERGWNNGGQSPSEQVFTSYTNVGRHRKEPSTPTTHVNFTVVHDDKRTLHLVIKSGRSHVWVHVLCDDMIKPKHAKFDIIVSPCDAKLSCLGGLSRSIIAAAGPYVHSLCEDHVKSVGPIEVTKFFVTPGGSITCSDIIHVVGPHPSQEQQVQQLTANAYYNCLLHANQPSLSATSIGLPLLGSGKHIAIHLIIIYIY